MPSSYSIDTLPKPINNKITIKQIPENKMVVISFNGKNEEKNISKHEAKLMDFIAKNNLKCVKTPIYAFYNPWTLPILRKMKLCLRFYKNEKFYNICFISIFISYLFRRS